MPTDHEWHAVMFARTLLPLVQVPPAGFWRERRRPSFVVDPRPLPDPDDAATLVLGRYLGAFGPASKRDVAAWAGVRAARLRPAWERLETVAYRDEQGTELLDLPDQPLPPAIDQAAGSLPGALGPGRCWPTPTATASSRPSWARWRLTLSGDQTVTVDGRVAASWKLERATRRVQGRDRAAPRDPQVGARADPRRGEAHGAASPSPEAERIEVAGV